MTESITADQIVDCRGTLCPMPIIRLRQAIDLLQPGQVVMIMATDPASIDDMPAFARNTGHELIQTGNSGGVMEYYFRKGED